ITREPGGRRVAARLVERAGGRVFGAGRCLDDNQSSVVSRQSLLHGPQERAPHALALPRGVHDDPVEVVGAGGAGGRTPAGVADELVARVRAQDRKSTRLNSSHGSSSYAVFCLKKKKKTNSDMHTRKPLDTQRT